MTIKELLDNNPEYADLQIVLYNPSGEYDFLGDSAMCYPDELTVETWETVKVLVFSNH